jgi:hypothetical protein
MQAKPILVSRRRTLLAGAIAALCAGQASAMQLDNGTGDLTIRWDNTLKYNVMNRVEDRDDRVVESNNPKDNPSLFDDADYGFDKGLVSSRFDLLSELDVAWKQKIGFRISGAGWWDLAYRDDIDGDGLNRDYFNLTNPHNPNYADTWGLLTEQPGSLNRAASDQAYRDAELLDAFVYGNFDVGDAGISVRLGRHTIYWGNSLFVAGAVHGIAGSMAPIDLAKGFGVPGSEAKELFLPTNKLSTTIQLNSSMSLVGYYSFEFEPTRLPAVGTYLSLGELLTDDAEFATLLAGEVNPVTGALVFPRAGLVQNQSEQPDEGEWGIGGQYAFENGLELGLYFLHYADKYPQGVTGVIDYGQFVSTNVFRLAPALVPAIPALIYAPEDRPDYHQFDTYNDGVRNAHGVGRFKWTYKDDNELIGLSLNKEIAGISFGADLVYRNDVAIVFDRSTLLHVENYATLVGGLGALVQGRIDVALAALGSDPQAFFDFAGADESNYAGPTGDTAHLVLNGVGFLNPSKFWHGGSYSFEMTAAAR